MCLCKVVHIESKLAIKFTVVSRISIKININDDELQFVKNNDSDYEDNHYSNVNNDDNTNDCSNAY